MSKSLQTLIAVGILIVSLSLGYYFAFFLPQEKNKEQLMVNQAQLMINQAQCAKQANITKIDYLQKSAAMNLGANASNLFVSNHYNQKLNKCLVDFTYTSCNKDIYGSHNCTNSDEIWDAYENAPLTQALVGIGKNANSNTDSYSNYMTNTSGSIETTITRDDYTKLSQELMTQ